MPSSRIYSQFTLWTLLIWATPQVGGSEPGQIVGCVYRNQIHYLQKLENGQIRVQRASLGPGKENNGLNVRLSTDVNQVPWRIGYGYFWVENPRRWPRFQWNKFFRLQYEKLEVNEFDPLPDNEEKAVPYGDFGEIIQSGWDDPVRGDLSSFSIAANFEFKEVRTMMFFFSKHFQPYSKTVLSSFCPWATAQLKSSSP